MTQVTAVTFCKIPVTSSASKLKDGMNMMRNGYFKFVPK